MRVRVLGDGAPSWDSVGWLGTICAGPNMSDTCTAPGEQPTTVGMEHLKYRMKMCSIAAVW